MFYLLLYIIRFHKTYLSNLTVYLSNHYFSAFIMKEGRLLIPRRYWCGKPPGKQHLTWRELRAGCQRELAQQLNSDMAIGPFSRWGRYNDPARPQRGVAFSSAKASQRRTAKFDALWEPRKFYEYHELRRELLDPIFYYGFTERFYQIGQPYAWPPYQCWFPPQIIL